MVSLKSSSLNDRNVYQSCGPHSREKAGVGYTLRLPKSNGPVQALAGIAPHLVAILNFDSMAELNSARFPKQERRVAVDLAHGWPDEVRLRVLQNWATYGFR
jgi:hypothetical protein